MLPLICQKHIKPVFCYIFVYLNYIDGRRFIFLWCSAMWFILCPISVQCRYGSSVVFTVNITQMKSHAKVHILECFMLHYFLEGILHCQPADLVVLCPALPKSINCFKLVIFPQWVFSLCTFTSVCMYMWCMLVNQDWKLADSLNLCCQNCNGSYHFSGWKVKYQGCQLLANALLIHAC